MKERSQTKALRSVVHVSLIEDVSNLPDEIGQMAAHLVVKIRASYKRDRLLTFIGELSLCHAHAFFVVGKTLYCSVAGYRCLHDAGLLGKQQIKITVEEQLRRINSDLPNR